ncbi:glutamate--tRNA ligase [Candidatus Nomurabacteria bacterium]|nr:glutamate--tRNA ligase [Candidatus Nomurabacteria bacterium]
MRSRVRTRFAPSPTGNLHLGGARTALFNYLFAKQNDGEFILRIDDTDKERSKPEFEENIFKGLKWLGLESSEVYHQSKRGELYRQKLDNLLKLDKVYVSSGEKVIRFRNPNTDVTFTDLIKGEITFNTTDLQDFIVAKDMDTPLYHFASVVDDIDLDISHVIRGEDHISNTPRQILLLEALGGTRPDYAHIPLILAPDRSKLSKRHGAVSVSEYSERGYLPEAMINFLVTMGWSPQAQKLEQELFSLKELIHHFNLKQVQTSGAVFNIDKLDWFNKEYVKRLPEKEQLSRLKSEHEFFNKRPTNIDKNLLKNTEHLSQVLTILEKLDEKKWSVEDIKEALWDFATEKGRGEVLWPLRVSLTGQAKSPDPFTVAAILGREETLDRLRQVLR